MHYEGVSPVVGSSRNMRRGAVISSAAMDTRRRSPPDSPRTHSSPMKLCATCGNEITTPLFLTTASGRLQSAFLVL